MKYLQDTVPTVAGALTLLLATASFAGPVEVKMMESAVLVTLPHGKLPIPPVDNNDARNSAYNVNLQYLENASPGLASEAQLDLTDEDRRNQSKHLVVGQIDGRDYELPKLGRTTFMAFPIELKTQKLHGIYLGIDVSRDHFQADEIKVLFPKRLGLFTFEGHGRIAFTLICKSCTPFWKDTTHEVDIDFR
jgi:hypothetical protein